MIKEKFAELKKEKIFNQRQGKLFLIFCITNVNLELEQIDFSFWDKNKKLITNFSYKNGRNRGWYLTKTKEERKIEYEEIRMEQFKKVKDLEKVKDSIDQYLKNKKLNVNKYIFILQANRENSKKNSKDIKTFFFITCLCSDFWIYKLKIDPFSLRLIEEKLYNLMNFFKISK